MGMTIEDIIQGLKETYMICCSVFAYDRKKYIDGAIDRLNKYQKIEQIVNSNPDYIHHTDMDTYKLNSIREVIENEVS